MKKYKNEVIFCLAVFTIICLTEAGFAQYGDSADIKGSLDKIIVWVTGVLGVAAVTFGIIFTGIKMSLGDERAWQNGLKIIGGGVIIFLAGRFVPMLQGWLQ